MEAALGLVGGTMGLLTGFSILSGVEVIYYLLRCFFCSHFMTHSILRFFWSLKDHRAVVVSAVNKLFEKLLTKKD